MLQLRQIRHETEKNVVCLRSDTINSFTTDTGINDVLVHGFVCRHRE